MISLNSLEFIVQTESDQTLPVIDFNPVKKRRCQALWALKENIQYVKFLKNNKKLFRTQKIRRKQKVFYKLAKKIASRSPDQCRTHHQKMMISHKNISQIIKYLEYKIFNFNFSQSSVKDSQQNNNFEDIAPESQSGSEIQQIQQVSQVEKQIWKLVDI